MPFDAIKVVNARRDTSEPNLVEDEDESNSESDQDESEQ